MLNRSANGRTASDHEQRAFRWYVLALTTIFIVMLLRLLFLQVVSWDQLRLRSIDNIIQAVHTPAPRGNVYDRAGRALAKNVTSYKLLYKPPVDIAKYYPNAAEAEKLAAAGREPTYLHRDTGHSLEEVQRLGAYLGMPYTQLMRGLGRELRRLNGKDLYGYKPATLLDRLEFPQVVYLEEHREEYQGFFIDEHAFERVYPLGAQASHLLGFTGYTSDADPERIQRLGYTNQEKVGKEGVERRFEELLHGRQGRRNIEVDRARIFQDIVSEVKPDKGTDVYLTIDARLQAKAFDVMGGKRGAVIVSALGEGHEGEILALVSSPSFDPYRMNESEYATRIFEDAKYQPSLNRAFRGHYVPGSTFKIVTATAMLQTKTVTPGTGFHCGGKKAVGNKDFHCHLRTGHGGMSMLYGIAKSCDIYFYNAALRLPDPPDNIAYYARQFGFGEEIGIDLDYEIPGRVPDRDWKRRRMAANGYPRADQRWYGGDTANYCIGQGWLDATPLQVLWSASILAWRGERHEPQLLYAHASGAGDPIRQRRARARRTRLDPAVLDIVDQGLRLAVTDGTCRQFNKLGLGVCAKTGTAETHKGLDHAWVVGYYPQQEPKYAFVCLVEYGGHGSDAAVPPMVELLSFMKANDPLGGSES